MSLKTIKVNPDLLSLAGSGNKSSSANTKTRKQKPDGVSLTQSNNVKKKLIARIKNFQQKPSDSLGTTSSSSSLGGTTLLNHSEGMASNSLTESIDFLNNLAREKEGKKREKKAIRRETLKHSRQPTDPSAYMSIATELPPELSLDTIKPYVPSAPAPNAYVPNASPVYVPNVSAPNVSHISAPNAPNVSAPNVSAPAPPYSNLKKGGSQPTYRTWLRNTQKNKPMINVPAVLPTISILDTEPEANNINKKDINENKNDENKEENNENNENNENKNDENKEEKEENKIIVANAPPQYKPSLARKRKRITRTLKYKLGKHSNGTVSVLIKNSQTRRKIQNEQSLLKQKSILDIKNYLRKNNLLKVGTQAPNDVLRHLYEQSILAGQVENKSKENLIHNYFNDEVK